MADGLREYNPAYNPQGSTMPHFIHDYTTTLRDCWAIMDDFGNLVPLNWGTPIRFLCSN